MSCALNIAFGLVLGGASCFWLYKQQKEIEKYKQQVVVLTDENLVLKQKLQKNANSFWFKW